MGWGLNQYRLVRIYMRRPCKGYYMRWYYNGWHYWFFLPGKSLVLTEGERYRTYGTKKVSMSSGQVTQSQIDAIRTILNSKEVAIYTNAGWMAIRIEQNPAIVFNNQVPGYEMDFIALIGSKEISYITGYSPIIDIPTIIMPLITQCEVVIGTQVWMCKNFDIQYPGSKVYGDDEANRTRYGGLYSFSQINNSGFCPAGWHVPSLDEWNTLINFLGGALVAGAKLKETGVVYWNYETADNSSSFAARGGGMYSSTFVLLREQANFWTKDKSFPLPYAYSIQLTDTGIDVQTLSTLKSHYLSVRLIKDTPAVIHIQYADWFLPSQDQLTIMHHNLHAHGVGDFTASGYWSSTENNATQAIYIDFADGFNYNQLKTATLRVRACRTFISSDIYLLRAAGPAGGLIFYIEDNGDGTFTYHESSLSDQSAGKTWSDITSALVGGTSQGIGSGQTNTNLIVAQVVEIMGWFLPSLDEANKMWLNLAAFAVGDFGAAGYWTSSEYSIIKAHGINMASGYQFNYLKFSPLSIRACRMFISNIIYALRDVGPAGGLIFDIIDNGDGTFTYFEAAIADISGTFDWSNVDANLVGGTDTAIGTGPPNTMLIINQPGHTDSAAKLCNDLNVGGTTVDSAAKLCDDLIT